MVPRGGVARTSLRWVWRLNAPEASTVTGESARSTPSIPVPGWPSCPCGRVCTNCRVRARPA